MRSGWPYGPRRDGVWRISDLTAVYEWDTLHPAVPGTDLRVDPGAVAGLRHSYRWLAYTRSLAGETLSADLPGIDRIDAVNGIAGKLTAKDPQSAVAWLAQLPALMDQFLVLALERFVLRRLRLVRLPEPLEGFVPVLRDRRFLRGEHLDLPFRRFPVTRQLGGDLTRFAFVCLLGQHDDGEERSAILERQARSAWDAWWRYMCRYGSCPPGRRPVRLRSI